MTPVNQALRRIVKPGWMAGVVGAGAGYYTSLLAELVGPSGKVEAYEPDPDIYDQLVKNTERWRNITYIRAAVGDYNGSGLLRCGPEGSQMWPTPGVSKEMEVPVVQLPNHYNFIKVNARGWEGRVIMPMTRFPPMLISWWPEGLQDIHPSFLMNILQARYNRVENIEVNLLCHND
jgi:FkbM family methyltransferase